MTEKLNFEEVINKVFAPLATNNEDELLLMLLEDSELREQVSNKLKTILDNRKKKEKE